MTMTMKLVPVFSKKTSYIPIRSVKLDSVDPGNVCMLFMTEIKQHMGDLLYDNTTITWPHIIFVTGSDYNYTYRYVALHSDLIAYYNCYDRTPAGAPHKIRSEDILPNQLDFYRDDLA